MLSVHNCFSIGVNLFSNQTNGRQGPVKNPSILLSGKMGGVSGGPFLLTNLLLFWRFFKFMLCVFDIKKAICTT